MSRFIALLCIVGATFALDPNEKLKKCCSTLKTDVDKDCVDRFCDFNAISQTNILNFLGTCSDKGGTVGQMWDCASLRHDHTECCRAAGVDEKCLAYCSAQDGVPTNYLDYVFCTEDFNSIRDCFYNHLDKNPPFSKKGRPSKGPKRG